MKYEIVIYWSKEDKCYVAIVPELSGCMAHGDTYSETLKEIETAMKSWVEVAKKTGKNVPEPKEQLVHV